MVVVVVVVIAVYIDMTANTNHSSTPNLRTETEATEYLTESCNYVTE